MLRCIECDAYTTGVIDHNHDGFARCAAHARMLWFRWAADAEIPRVKGRATKTWQAHRETVRRMLTGRAIDKLTREGAFYPGQRYTWQAAEDRLRVDPMRRPEADPRPYTVKAPDLFGAIHETYATEAELNGHRSTQGRLI